MNTTAIQIRIDQKTKKEAQKTLEELGLDISTGIKLFLRRVVKTHSIPFDVTTQNGLTLREEMDILKETKIAIKKGKRYKSAKEMHSHM